MEKIRFLRSCGYWKSLLQVTVSLLVVSTSANAGLVGSTTSVTITSYYVQSTFGNGDVAFTTSSSIAGCENGFWLRTSDDGFKSLVATVIMAYTTKSNVQIWAYDNELWPGSSGKFCRIDAIRPI